MTDILLVIKKRYWLIIAGAVIAGAIALVLSLLWPSSYEAEAMLLITKLRPSVTLDPRFETVAEENVVNLTTLDDQVRRQTLVALTDSSDLMLQVIEELGDTLPLDERTVEYLSSATSVDTHGNLLVFGVEAETPDKAAAMANAWATVFQEHVNRLYSATSPTFEQIETQLAGAQAEYESAKSAFEDFVKQSDDEELTRQIEQKRKVLADLEQEYLASNKRRVYRLLARLEGVDRLLVGAQNLKAQLEDSTSTMPLTEGEAFALFALQSETFAEAMALPITVELGAEWTAESDLTAGQAIDRLERLMVTLEAVRTETQAELDSDTLEQLSGSDILAGGPDSQSAESVTRLQTEINELEAMLQALTMEEQDLLDASTVAQESYFTLVRKAAEVQILSELTGVEVQKAADAQPPEKPAFPTPLIATFLGVVAGGLAGLVLAFIVELWPREEEAGE